MLRVLLCVACAVAVTDNRTVTSSVWFIADDRSGLGNFDAGTYACNQCLLFLIIIFKNLFHRCFSCLKIQSRCTWHHCGEVYHLLSKGNPAVEVFEQDPPVLNWRCQLT